MLLRKRKDGSAKRRRIRKLRLLALVLVLWLLALAAFFFGLVTGIATGIPSLDPSRVQAVEDKRFYEHRGVDLHGIVRAIWADIRHKGVVQGGSTITQQFVKNSLVHSRRSIARKLKEAALAWQLERQWSKTRILTAYLNTIYFGNGAYGVQTAARAYFGHGASKLTLPEAALLAGIPEDPAGYDPVANPKAARARREVVLRAMLDQEHITRADFRRANKAPLPNPDKVGLPGTSAWVSTALTPGTAVAAETSIEMISA